MGPYAQQRRATCPYAQQQAAMFGLDEAGDRMPWYDVAISLGLTFGILGVAVVLPFYLWNRETPR